MEIKILSFDELDNDQLYALLKLRVDIFVVEQNCPYPELDNKDQTALHMLGTQSNELVAYLRVYFNMDAAVIGRIITHEKHRKKGLSSQLIEEAMNYIKNHSSSKSIKLQAQEHLVSYYSRFGFKPVSDRYVWDGIPHIDMEIEIRKT